MAKKYGKKKVSKKTKKEQYTCEQCGLVITVDETCNCVDVCDIICCGVPMKPKK